MCQGVEISGTAETDGCSCSPNSERVCTFTTALQDQETRCFQCSARDFHEGPEDKCESCWACMKECDCDGCFGTEYGDSTVPILGENSYTTCAASMDGDCVTRCGTACNSDLCVDGDCSYAGTDIICESQAPTPLESGQPSGQPSDAPTPL